MQLSLRPFQQEALKKSIEFLKNSPSHSLYNGSDPGTGKTIMTIAALDELAFKKILIICPAVMVLTWRAEYNKWSRNGFKDIIVVTNGRDFRNVLPLILPSENPLLVIISYGLATTHVKLLAKLKWDVLVMDEAHYLKNSRAARTRAILKTLWPLIPYRVALSGTPFLKHVTDCYSLFFRMLPGVFGSFYDFAGKFSTKVSNGFGFEYKGIKNVKILSKLIRDNFFIRYVLEEVAPEIPPVTYQKISLPSSKSVAAYEKTLKTLYPTSREQYDPDLTRLNKAPPTFNEMLRLQGEAKVLAVVAYVKELLEQDVPVLIFCRHTSVIEMYMCDLDEFNPLKIDGAVLGVKREAAIKTFQEAGTNVLVLQHEAGGVGITLTRARYVVFAELPFSPATVTQCVRRAQRIGQKNILQVIYFSCINSIDEHISSLIVKKAIDFTKLFNKKDTEE